MSAEDSKPARPKRRWYQYSLRTLLVLIALFAVWLGLRIHGAQQQKEAVEALLRADGSIVYDSQWDHPVGGYSPQGRSLPPGSNWLRRQLGNDFFDEVTGVCFKGTFQEMRSHDPWGPSQHIDVSALSHLRNLHELRRLDLRRMDVKDRGLVHLGGLVGLEVLNLKLTQVTDGGLTRLSGLTNLRELDMSQNRITDAGLVHLAGMARLQTLRLKGTKVTDEGVKKLQEALPKCRIER